MKLRIGFNDIFADQRFKLLKNSKENSKNKIQHFFIHFNQKIKTL
jgi:hypothetical protein